MIMTTADDDTTKQILDEGGYTYIEGESILAEVDDRPGGMAALSRQLADAGVNIYGHLFLGRWGDRAMFAFVVDDPDKARPILERKRWRVRRAWFRIRRQGIPAIAIATSITTMPARMSTDSQSRAAIKAPTTMPRFDKALTVPNARPPRGPPVAVPRSANHAAENPAIRRRRGSQSGRG